MKISNSDVKTWAYPGHDVVVKAVDKVEKTHSEQLLPVMQLMGVCVFHHRLL